MQRVISFDIGIKNMAYCIFDTQVLSNYENQPFNILDWGVLNLLPEKTCSIICNQVLCPIKKGKGKGKKNDKPKIENFFIPSPPINELTGQFSPSSPSPENICSKIAKYKNGTHTFCEKHGKTSSYKKIPLPSKMASKTIAELQVLYDGIVGSPSTGPAKPSTIGTGPGIIKPSKKGLIEKIQSYIENHALKPIKVAKTATSNTIDLITIGHALNRQMTEVLDRVDPQKAITHVIIENQISPIANRMKTVQGMLAQFFIIKYGDKCHIEFISSANKLKIFDPSGSKKKNTENLEQDPTQGGVGGVGEAGGEAAVQTKSIGQSAPLIEGSQKIEINPEYKQHKKDGIFYCRGILESNSWLKGHIELLNTKKKDDLADCFLQGIWYLVREKRISIAENLKINSVIRL